MRIQSMSEHAGCITWWSLGAETDPDGLLHRFDKLGLPKYAPEQRTWLMSLKAALTDQFPGKMIRPLKRREKNGYSVVEEIKGERENNFPALGSATITDEGEVIVRSGDFDRQALQDKANHYRRVLPASSVSAVMIEIINSVLGGIAMREGGGIYFVPENMTGKWMNIAKAVEESACNGVSNSVTICPMETNAMTLRDIRDAIVREVETEAAAIRKELADNDLGDRAIQNRVDRSGNLFNRMKQYEGLLGETLAACRDALRPTLQALQAAKAEREADQVFEDLYEVA